MKSLLLIADTNTQLNQLRELLGPIYTLFTAASLDEALDYLRLTKVDVVITACEDRTFPCAELFEQAKAIQPHCVTCYIAPPLSPDLLGSENDLPRSDFLLRRPFDGNGLRLTLEQALEKQRLLEEIGALREQRTSPQPPAPSVNGGELSFARIGQILRNFTKAFGTNFDLQRTLNLFVEAISEFLRPSRLSIMVHHSSTRVFEIRAHHGLAPKVAEQLRLREDEGLPQWLMTEARIVHRSEVESQLRTPAYLEIHREMQALKAVVSIPLMASGTLVGILNLGERVTGVPYTKDELEILFSLADHVAVGIQDITLYHTIQAQQIFTEKILRYMKSGVITISLDEKISLCNHRAAEILGVTWFDVLHKDLRSLPSPLGDLLYETLCDGVAYHHYEVTLAAGKIPLEVSTYQIFNEPGEISGSVMVFDDLSFQKQLSEERRRGDQLDFLNRVVGRMAHEIKNPLVSIQTFVELLDDQYNDPEFRDYFRDVVSRDVRTVDSITEKLVSFASKISYHFTNDDINKALHRLVEALTREPATVTTSTYSHDGSETTHDPTPSCVELVSTELLLLVKFDPEQFHKALMYLALFLLQDVDGGGKIRLSSQLGLQALQPYSGDWVSITLTGQGRKLSPEELHQLFDPFCMEQSTLVDVGPCVSQKIIEEHGGHLDVRQEKDGDTTFMIVLPIAQQAVEGNER
jgi:nitrogen-specific signal transduction histidine kinase